MQRAMTDALDKYTVGVASIWESKKTGRAGRAILTRTYEVNGMRSARLTHHFTKGAGATYTAPLCKTADGAWKLAF